MRHLLMVVLLAALPLAAQEKQTEPPQPRVQKLFVLKYADPNQVAPLLAVFTSSLIPNREMHALAVSAPQDVMPAIEDAIKRLDVPSSAPQSIELTAYLLTGISQPGASTAELPKDLDSVVTQLKNVFTYKSYRLMDVLALRTRTGQRAETSSSGAAVQIGNASIPIITQFQINSAVAGTDGTIRINGLKLGNRVPVSQGAFNQGANQQPQYTYLDLGINTDVDIKQGQKVVVGKMGINPNEALFLVLTAQVAQ